MYIIYKSDKEKEKKKEKRKKRKKKKKSILHEKRTIVVEAEVADGINGEFHVNVPVGTFWFLATRWVARNLNVRTEIRERRDIIEAHVRIMVFRVRDECVTVETFHTQQTENHETSLMVDRPVTHPMSDVNRKIVESDDTITDRTSDFPHVFAIEHNIIRICLQNLKDMFVAKRTDDLKENVAFDPKEKGYDN
jgi:hypothetical protein